MIIKARHCKNPACGKTFTPLIKTTETCSRRCGQAWRIYKATICQQCGDTLDRKGFICNKCKIANRLEQQNIDNAKRGSTKKSNFEKKFDIPIRHDIVALAYGWVN